MKIMLISAKQSLAESLASRPGVEVVQVRQQRAEHSSSQPKSRAPLRYYCGGAKLNFRAAWQIRKLLRVERPDIVHAFYGRALAQVVLAAMTLPAPPTIVSFRGILSPLSPRDIGDWLSYRHRLVAAHACESDAVRHALVNSGIDAARCATVYNSMVHHPARRPGRAALEAFKIPPGAFVVGTMATMRPVKGIDLLLRAAIRCADLADTHYLLFGEVVDPVVRQFAADPRIRDRVRLVGHRPDAVELISGADVFVMPSRSEALCQALLEAMHQGVCPVVSDAGGMPEVVRHGTDGLVFPAENVAALVDAIRVLHADRRLVSRLADSATKRIAAMFTPEKMADRCLALYQRLHPANRQRAAA